MAEVRGQGGEAGAVGAGALVGRGCAEVGEREEYGANGLGEGVRREQRGRARRQEPVAEQRLDGELEGRDGAVGCDENVAKRIGINSDKVKTQALLLEGLLCGISAGTNVVAAVKLAAKLGKGKTVVTVLPDTAERYFSTPLFNEE